jgi:DNA-binding winged helix-turn-helix (wHTH) protein
MPSTSVPITPARPPKHVPPLRNETALTVALCLMFKLRRSEAHVLMKMATGDFVSKDEIFSTVTRSDRARSDNAVSVHINMMRKKLLPYSIEIITMRGFGYGLRKESRRKICQRLAEYDAELIPTAPSPKGRAALPPKRRSAHIDQSELVG